MMDLYQMLATNSLTALLKADREQTLATGREPYFHYFSNISNVNEI